MFQENPQPFNGSFSCDLGQKEEKEMNKTTCGEEREKMQTKAENVT